MSPRLEWFPKDARYRLIFDLALIYSLSLIVHWGMCPTFMMWNDAGYHARMADLLLEKGILPAFDGRWRGGILVNYPMAWATCLAIGSLVSGLTVWEVYPFVLLIVWSLLPCSIYLMVTGLTEKRVAGLLAAAMAFYPSAIPDQGALICALVIVPIAILLFLKVLREPTWKRSVGFGVVVGLLFHSNLLAFQFIVFTFAVTFGGYCVFVLVRASRISSKAPVKDLGWLIAHLALAVAVCLVLTAHWWVLSYRVHGSAMIEHPLADLGRAAIERASWSWGHVYAGNVLIRIGCVISALCMLLLLRPLLRAVRRYGLEMFYFMIFVVLAVCLYRPYDTLNLVLSVPWRYYIFVHLAVWTASGLCLDVILGWWLAKMTEPAIPIRVWRGIMVVGLMILIAMVATVHTRYWRSVGNVPYTVVPTFSLRHYDTNLAAMLWLDKAAAPGSVVAARPAHSSSMLYHTGLHTLSGHYGGFNPDPSRDEALNTILFSSDVAATWAAVKKFDVDVVYVDMANPGSGSIFEDSIYWQKTFRSRHSLQKLTDMFTVIYDWDDVLIFATGEVPDITHKTEDLGWTDKIRSMSQNVELRGSSGFGEDFVDISEWDLTPLNVADGQWGVAAVDGIVSLWQESDALGKYEEVYASYSFSEDEEIPIRLQTKSMAKIRYRVSDKNTRLHMAFEINTRWYDVHLDATEWTIDHIYLPTFRRGTLTAVHWGVWEEEAENGRHSVEIDYLIIE